MRLAKLGFLFHFTAGSKSSTEIDVATKVMPDYAAGGLLQAMFDPAWYLERYADAVDDLAEQESMTAFDHYLTKGLADGRVGTPFFDAEWYVGTYLDVPVAGRRRLYPDALEHYLSKGYLEHRNPNAIFDEDWYDSRYSETLHGSEYFNGYHHFLAEGAAAGFNPSPLFDECWYRRVYGDVAAAIAAGLLRSGFDDYVRCSPQAERSPCPYFDPVWYNQTYPATGDPGRFKYWRFLTDGAANGENPSPYFDENWYRQTYRAVHTGVYSSAYRHFLYEGARAGCSPNPFFHPKWYCDWYPEVRNHIANERYSHPFEHYICEGAAQGLNPNPYFDEAWYLYTNPDVAEAVRKGSVASGHIHYLNQGSSENRKPSTVFDADWYRATYPDVDQYIGKGLASSAYDHFIRYGRLVSRSASAEFDEQWYLERHPDVEAEIREGKWLDGLHHFVEEGMLRGYAPTRSSRQDRREQNVTVAACATLELADFLKKNRELICETGTNPLVSIVLVLYNRAELTLRCLRSIVNWADIPYEVIVVDNASHDETSEMLSQVRGVRVISNDRNMHFLRAANQGARAARGEYLLFLNNDSELQVGALASAAGILECNPDVGAVGAKIILNNGVLQEAGSYLLQSGFSAQFGRGRSPFASEFMHRRDVPYCSGAFLMTPRRLFLDSGAFDTAFLPAYFEDVDYCLRLWKKGLRVVFNSDSILLHHETASSSFHRLLWPSVMRNLAVLRARYREQLETAPDYSQAPIGSLDGWRMREGYLLIVDSIEGVLCDDAVFTLVDKMLARKLFVSIYPLKPWVGERVALKSVIPDEVEVVGGSGIDDLERFCLARKNVYAGGVCLSRASEVVPLLSRIRQWLPKGCLLSDER
jgi:GT2 family glycosyltransferase